MLNVTDAVNFLKSIPEPLPLPKPPPPPKPQTDTIDAKIAAQRERESQIKNNLERLEKKLPSFLEPVLKPLVGLVENSLEANHTPELIRLLAQKNAPLLVLPSGNLPTDPQTYIDHSRLRENVPVHLEPPDLSFWNGSFDPTPIGAKDNRIGDNTNGDTSDDFTGTDVANVESENAFLDLDNGKRNQLGNANAPVFYQFERAEYDANSAMTKPPKLTYHIFYDFNNGPTPVGGGTPVGDHEGDWERVTYELNPQTLEPQNMVFSQHNGGSRFAVNDENSPASASLINRDPLTNRPLVYVATGSHANYNQPGSDYATEAPLTKDKTVVDQNGDGLVNQADGAYIFDSARNLNEVTSQDWHPTGTKKGTHWGEISATENYNLGDANSILPSGPQGPSPDKGAVEP